MTTDIPQISRSTYNSQVIPLHGQFVGMTSTAIPPNPIPDFYEHFQQNEPQTQKEIMANTSRRIVQVFIADPNDNVPLEESVLYRGEQKLSDLTDTELFFEVPIADLLKKHNEKRSKWLDKEATKRAGKDVLLEPAKIRELKMVVVTVATF